MSRKGSNEVGEGVVELVFVGVNVAVGGCIAGDHLQTAMVVASRDFLVRDFVA